MNQQNPGDSLIDFINSLIPSVINDAPNLFNTSIRLLVLAFIIWWIYLGIQIYHDSQKRFDFESKYIYYLILVLGIISGPIGLIVYNIVKPKQTQGELDFIKVEHKFYYHQASKVVDCLDCGAYVLENHRFCTNCGVQNRFKCSKCGNLTDYDDNYCYTCGINFGNRRNQIFKRSEEKKLREKGKKTKNNYTQPILPQPEPNKTDTPLPVPSPAGSLKGNLKTLFARAKTIAKQTVDKASDLTQKASLRREKAK